MRYLIFAFVAFLIVLPASSQDRALPFLDAAIESVISGGYWTNQDKAEGQFRVVVDTGGYEHLISSIWVQWIAQPKNSEDSAQIVMTKHLEEVDANYVRLSEPKLTLEGNRWILTVESTQTHCDPMPVKRWHVALGPPGQAIVIGSEVIKSGCDE